MTRRRGKVMGKGEQYTTFAPSTEQRTIVERAAAIGLTHAQICHLIDNPQSGAPISEVTLRKHFERELAGGASKALFNVANNLYSMAVGKGREAVTAAIFYLKTKGKWREGTDVIHGGTVTHDHQHSGADLAKLSGADLDREFEKAIRASQATRREPGGTTH